MEQIRIIKELRDADRRTGRTDVLIRPRWMVWENVPGALSSGQPKGEDFRIVLEEILKVKDPDAVVPRPKDGKWTNAGCVVANGVSVAWRILDGQHWGISYFGDDGMPTKLGTPQRRRRIALVADFATEWGAPQILFERESLSGDFEPSREEGQGTAGDTEEGADSASYTLKIRGGRERDSLGKKAGKGPLVQTERSATLGVSQDQTLIQPTVALEGNGTRESHHGDGYIESDVSYTLNSTEQHGVAYGVQVGASARLGQEPTEETAPTLRAEHHSGDNQASVISFDPSFSSYYGGTTFTDVAKTLAQGTAPGFHDGIAYAEAPDTHTHTHRAFAESGFSKWEEGEQSIPIRASGGCIGGGSETLIAEDRGNSVR